MNEYTKKNLWSLIAYILFFLFTLFTFSFLFSYIFVFIPSPLGLISSENSDVWLQWVGSFIGGAVGGILALVGIKVTIENQRKIIQFENKRKALPLIDVQEGKYDYKNKYILFNFCFTNESERREIENPANITVEFINVGLREMYDFYIDEIESKFFKSHGECYYVSPIVYQNKSVNINFKFREPLSLTYSGPENLETTIVSPLIFKCYFKDCYDNWYYQKLSINFMHSYDGQTVANHKGLNVEYQGYEILSKPIEIPKENLPWNNGKEVIRM